MYYVKKNKTLDVKLSTISLNPCYCRIFSKPHRFLSTGDVKITPILMKVSEERNSRLLCGSDQILVMRSFAPPSTIFEISV